MWEVMTFAQKPFESLSDFRFVEFALNETDELANEIGKLRVLVSHLKNKIIYSRYNRLCTKYPHCSRSGSKIDLRFQRKFQWDMKFWGKSYQKI